MKKTKWLCDRCGLQSDEQVPGPCSVATGILDHHTWISAETGVDDENFRSGAEVAIAEYDTLQKIVDQLAGCQYESKVSFGPLEMNVAFIALKRAAFFEVTDPEQILTAAYHALRSYEHGNGAPDLAKQTADAIDAFWTARAEMRRAYESH